MSADFSRQFNLTSSQRGLRVTDVVHGSPAYLKLFANTDVITEVMYPGPRRPVRNATDLQRALDSLKTGDVISLFVVQVSPTGPTTRVVNVRVGG